MARYDNKNVMAGAGLSLFRTMKELPERNGDLTPDDDDMSVRDERENLQETDPNCYEERFRVDRRKLEQMMQGKSVCGFLPILAFLVQIYVACS